VNLLGLNRGSVSGCLPRHTPHYKPSFRPTQAARLTRLPRSYVRGQVGGGGGRRGGGGAAAGGGGRAEGAQAQEVRVDGDAAGG